MTNVLPATFSSVEFGRESCEPPRWQVAQRGDTTWRVEPQLESAFLAEDGLPIDRWLREGQAEIVKHGRHRTVYRVGLPCGTFFVKHYRVADWRALLQNIVRPSKAELEWNAVERVRAAGIPTVARVAFGVRKRSLFSGGRSQESEVRNQRAGGRGDQSGPLTAHHSPLTTRHSPLALTTDSFLISREIDNVHTLHDFVVHNEQTADPQLRRAVARSLGEMIAGLHRRGLLHRDLHAGNILVRVEPGGAVRLWLIDLHGLCVRRRLSAQQVADNLALFGVFFHLRATAADRQQFFDAYWHRARREPTAVSDWLRSRDPAALAGIEQLLERACARRWQKTVDKADRKWFRGHRKLIIARNAQTHCRGVAALGEEFVRRVCDAPEALSGQESGVRSQGTGDRTTYRLPLATHHASTGGAGLPEAGLLRSDSGDGRTSRRRWLGRTYRWSNSRAVWEIGHALLRRGIPVATPLLYAESQTGGKGREWLLTEDVTRDAPAKLTPDALRQSAAILRRLHEQRFVHRALRPASFISSNGRVLLEGIEHVHSIRRLKPRDRIAQLAALNAAAEELSPANRLRFLLEYLGESHRQRWKAVWRAIAESSPPTDNSGDASPSRRRFLEAAVVAGAMLLGCRTPKRPQLALPSQHSIRSGQMLVLSDVKLRENHPLIQDLILLRKQVTVGLQLPPQREKVVVYIFRNQQKYREYLNRAYPGLPDRRAYFVGTPDELAVYTYWGERIQEDLRHEYTHGLLHASLRNVPLWIDEGLAEYFEVAGARPGTVNTEYAGRLAASLANGWKPNLPNLERLEEFSQMQHVHYQEAWAWVHFLLHGEGTRDVLLGYLHDLRTQSNPPRLSERLRTHQPNYEERFVAHVAHIQTLLSSPAVRPVAGRASVGPFPK